MARNPRNDDEEDTQKIELGLIVNPPAKNGNDKTLTDFERPQQGFEPTSKKKTPLLIRKLVWAAIVCVMATLAWQGFLYKYSDEIRAAFYNLEHWYMPKEMQ